MTAPTPTPDAPDAPETPDLAPTKPRTLEESLADLDDTTRSFVLGEVTKARNEAKGLRDRVKAAEPKVAEYDRLAAASKTDAERAQEATQAANDRATKAIQRAARAEVKTALTAAGVADPDAIVDDLNLARFVDEDGEVDGDAVTKLREKYAAFQSPRAPRPDPSQGSGANGGASTGPAQDFQSLIRAAIGR